MEKSQSKLEQEWEKFISNWDAKSQQNNKKIKKLCKKGIPPNLRPSIWLKLSGADIMIEKHSELFETLSTKPLADPHTRHILNIDIPRVYPNHTPFFDDEKNKVDLFKVMQAFVNYAEDIGYMHQVAQIAALLLTLMSAHESFWVVVSITKYYMPEYYPSMKTFQLDSLLFSHFLRRSLPWVWKYLQRETITESTYLLTWLSCIYLRKVPYESVLRIWDMFLYVGMKFLLQTGLAVLKIYFPTTKQLIACTVEETLEVLMDRKCEKYPLDDIVQEAIEMKIKDKDFIKTYEDVLLKHPEMKVERFFGNVQYCREQINEDEGGGW